MHVKRKTLALILLAVLIGIPVGVFRHSFFHAPKTVDVNSKEFDDLHKKEFLEIGRVKFTLIWSVKQVPPYLLDYAEFPATKMADPGMPFQMGCVGNGSLPFHRLVLAGTTPKYSFLCYEHGGIAHGYILLFLKEHQLKFRESVGKIDLEGIGKYIESRDVI